MILNRSAVILIKVANKVIDFMLFILGIFGLKPNPELKDWYYQGVRFTEIMHKGKVEQIPDFEVHDSDIFLITYPRSGTHYTTEIIDCILDGGDTSRMFEVHQISRCSFIDMGHELIVVPILRILLSVTGSAQRAGKDISGYYKSVKAPRFFRSHVPVYLAPKQLVAGKGKLVYVGRNPIDTMVSQLKLWSSMEAMNLKYPCGKKYCEQFIDGDVLYGSWFDHVVGYWNCRDKKNVLFLKYEDIRADIRGTIRKLAKFLDRGPFSDEIVEKIADHCSLKNMKANEMTGPDVLIPSSAKVKGKESGFIRKGVVGGWKHEISAEQSKKLKEEYKKKVEKHGLTFKFEK